MIRTFTDLEKQEIADFLQELHGLDEEERGDLYDKMENTVCIPNYMTDSPGFCGSLYIIVWPGAPEIITYLTRVTRIDKFHVIFDGELPSQEVSDGK